jgi:hypothetical protein
LLTGPLWKALRAPLLRLQVFRDLREGRLLRLHRQHRSGFPILLDYEVRSVPRYGYGKPPHPGLLQVIDAGRQRYAATIRGFLEYREALVRIPREPPGDPTVPHWGNGYFLGLDAVALYAFAAEQNPRTYLEIGSGHSTRFLRRAVRDQGLRTRVVSIDPHPRAEIDRLCDEIHRQGLEEMDLEPFRALAAGDILFVDGSHRVFMNSDVTVLFLDVLPSLPGGVLVYIDDIYLPYDYPPDWIERYYSEQYLLAVLLLADPDRYEIVLPSTFIERDPELRTLVDPLRPIASGPGNGFWLRTR